MSEAPSPGARRAGPRRLLALGLCAALACLWALASATPVAAAPARPADSVGQQAVQVDSPAVVRIVSEISANLTCAGCASDGSDIQWPFNGSSFTYYSSGSGAFISPAGTILTADHVVDHSVNNPDDFNYVKSQALQDIASNYNTPTSQTLALAIQQSDPKLSVNFRVVVQEAFLSTAYTGKVSSTQNIYPFHIASTVASSPVAAQDTAIVQIDTSGIKPAPDFPYLTLANSTVNALDNVTAIAFPAAADCGSGPNNTNFIALLNADPNNISTINCLLTPSANIGKITKASDVFIYGDSSIASSGSSGGPVINNQGQVIGFVRGELDSLTQIIPSAAVAKLAGQAGVSTATQGRFMGLWSRAMTEYNATTSCHWTNAKADLTTLKAQYPTFGAVAPYLAQAQQSAASETCAAGTSTTATGDVAAGLWIIGGCAVAGLALILGVIFLAVALTRRRRRPSIAAAPYVGSLPAHYTPQEPPALPYQPGQQPPASPSAARVCPNGHMVVESDATFCPNCGAPLQR